MLKTLIYPNNACYIRKGGSTVKRQERTRSMSYFAFDFPWRKYNRLLQRVPLQLFFCGFLLACLGCSVGSWPFRTVKTEGCKIRTHTNAKLVDYVSGRFSSTTAVRALIIPFDVPESFAGSWNNYHDQHYGRELARLLRAELARTGELGIIELFAQNSWPGKRDEYFVGNYRAIQLAKDAGFQILILGHMEDLKNDEEMVILTKIIDATNNVTIWDAKTMVYSRDRAIGKLMGDMKLLRERPDLFNFPERAEEFAYCTVNFILTREEMPKI